MTVLAWTGLAALGGLGAVARFLVDRAVSARLPTAFPVGTLAVNVSGSLALGVLAGAGVAGRPLLVLGSGFLGGYTTFSTWMVESQRLGEEGATRLLLLNLAAPLLLGFGALAAGWAVGSAVA